MKKTTMLVGILSALIVLGLQTSCETTDGSDLQVRISPPGAKISNGESIEFTASGGFDYQWSIESSSLGFLSTRTGSRTVYTANNVTPTGSVSVIQFLRLTSSITTAATPPSSNGLPAQPEQTFTITDEVVIEHLPSPGSAGDDTEPIAVSPIGVTLIDAGQQTFVASGQGPNYAWLIDNAAFGGIAPTTGSTTIYTYNGLAPAGTTITLTVTSNGQSTQVSILLNDSI